jgi:hypothetical protein
MNNDDENENVKMDPRSAVTRAVMATVMETDLDHQSDAQTVADVLMAVLIMANMTGLEDLANLLRMSEAGQDNAAKAALYLLAKNDT